MKTLALALQIIFTAMGKENDEELLEMQKVYTHGPALMTKKQAMLSSRSTRLMSALERLKTEKAIKTIKRYHLVFGITEESKINLTKRKNQEFSI